MAFIHILLSIVVMSIVSDIRLGVGFLADATYEEEFEWVDDNDDFSDTHLANPGALRS